MNLAEISELARVSWEPTDMGEYANGRAKWCYDPAYKNEHMWWGREQPYYKFLYKLTHTYPGIYLEVGTHKGIGFACAAAGGARSNDPMSRYAIGIDKDNHGEARDVADYFERATFIHGMSTDIATVNQIRKICENTGFKISIMFVDARHTMADANSELKVYKEFYADQVLWVFDDIITKANNTHLPLMFDRLPGQKAMYENLHTDNCVAISLVSKEEWDNWDPGKYNAEDLARGFRYDEAPGPEHHQRY